MFHYRNIYAFSKLLLGPKILKLLEKVIRQVGSSEDVQHELYHAYLENTKFKEVLKGAKRVCYISDSSGLRFENLAQEMEAQHPLLKSLLDEVRKGKLDSRQEERDSLSQFVASLRLC